MLFNRTVTLSVGGVNFDKIIGNKFIYTSSDSSTKTFIYQSGVGPRIEFDVMKYMNAGGRAGFNVAQIKIYNITDETFAWIAKAGQTLIFQVGYESNITVLFAGSISSVYRTKTGADIISHLCCYSDGVRISDSCLSENVVNETVSHYLDRICRANGLNIKRDAVQGTIINETFDGSFIDVIKALSIAYKFCWYVEGNTIHINSQGRQNNEMYRFSKDTGLQDIPIITEKGCDIKSFLVPGLNASDYFYLDSKFVTYNLGALEFVERVRGNDVKTFQRQGGRDGRFQGIYRALMVHHIGSTHSNTWRSEIEGIYE